MTLGGGHRSRSVEIRAAGLIAFIASVVSLPSPMWNATQGLLVAMRRVGVVWAIPLLAVLYFLNAILPAFFLALSINRDLPRISKPLRLMALAAALVFGILSVTALPKEVGRASARLSELSNLTYVLLLITLFRHTIQEPPPEVPVSRLLRGVTKAASLAWGVWSGFLFAALAGSPFAYMQLENLARQANLRTPGIGEMMMRQTRLCLSQACLFVAPYIVYRSLRSPHRLKTDRAPHSRRIAEGCKPESRSGSSEAELE